jgi:hypothetical protein
MILNSIKTKSRLHQFFFALGIFPIAAALMIHLTSKPLFGHEIVGPELLFGPFVLFLLAAVVLSTLPVPAGRISPSEATSAVENLGGEVKESDSVSLNSVRNAFVSLGLAMVFFVTWFFSIRQFDRATQIILICYGVLLSSAVCFFVLGFLVKGRFSDASR